MYAEKIINNQVVFYSEYKYNSKQNNIDEFINSSDFMSFIKNLQETYNIII
jgi:hypothetical protein